MQFPIVMLLLPFTFYLFTLPTAARKGYRADTMKAQAVKVKGKSSKDSKIEIGKICPFVGKKRESAVFLQKRYGFTKFSA
jgi:hypothetical protein